MKKMKNSLYRHYVNKIKAVLPDRAWSFLMDFKLRLLPKFRTIPLELKNKKIYSWSQFEKEVLKPNKQPLIIHQLVIPWFTPLFQRPQHMARAFAQLGCLSLYVTKELNYGFVQLEDNLWLASIEDSERVGEAYRIFYSTAGDLKYWMKRCPTDSKFIYEYIDHIDPKISWSQTDNLKRGFDLATSGCFHRAVASSKKLFEELAEKKTLPREKIIFVPNGVTVSDYEKNEYSAPEGLKEEFSNFTDKYEKIVGYFGALANWLDYELINSVVAKRKDLGFIFIGPDYLGGSEKLLSADNLLYLGPVDYSQLPYFSLRFDVAWIPFEKGEIAKATSPLKLYEYFAMQKPVIVTSDLIECQVYEEVLVASSLQELFRVLDIALVKAKDKKFKLKLRKLALENDWLVRAENYLRGINGK